MCSDGFPRQALMPGDCPLDRRRRKLRFDDKMSGTEKETDAWIGSRRGDLQLPRRQRQGALIDQFANAGQEMLFGLRERSADDDHGRIEDADDVRGHFTEDPSRRAHELNGFGLIDPNQIDDVARVLGLEAIGSEIPSQRPAGRARFHTTKLPAAAERRVDAGKLDVADVAGRALGAAIDAAVIMIPLPMPVPALMKRNWPTSGQNRRNSDSVIRLTSFSTSTGAAK